MAIGLIPSPAVCHITIHIKFFSFGTDNALFEMVGKILQIYKLNH